MFDFKFREDIESCYSLLQTKLIQVENNSIIEVKNRDELIDLSPCIGIYQEAIYFDGFNIDKEIEMYLSLHSNKKHLWTENEKKSSLEEKILFYTSLETNHDRYRTQVDLPFIDSKAEEELSDRLATYLSRSESVQEPCFIDFSDEKNGYKVFLSKGFADAVKDKVVYELKFVSELKHEHFLQCACYMIALELEKGILWNTRDNTMYEIYIPDKKCFLDAITTAITKHKITTYFEPSTPFSKPIVSRSIKTIAHHFPSFENKK